MRILLVTPPRYEGIGATRFNRCECLDNNSILVPLDLLYFSSILKDTNHEVKVIDANAENISYEEFRRRCFNFEPDVIIIKGVLNVIDHDLRIAKDLKKYYPDVRTVLSSFTCIGIPNWILDNYPYLDGFARGELDAFPEDVAIKQLDDIKGIVTRNKREAEIRIVEDLDSLPFPDWEQLLDINLYNGAPEIKPWYMITSSRGCPFNCSFCTIGGNKENAFKYRRRSAKNVVDELELAIDRFNLNSFLFFDETFTVPSHCKAVCEEMINRGLTNIPWTCNGEVKLVNDEMLDLMAKAGCYHIDYGIESLDKNVLKNANKPHTPSEAKKAVKLTRKYGMRPGGSIIIGLPGETKWTFYKTLAKYFLWLNMRIGFFSIAIPYPETRLFDYYEKYGYIESWDWSKYDQFHQNPPVNNGVLSSEDLVKMQALANEFLFIRGGLKSIPKVLASPSKLKYYLSKYFFNRGWSRTYVD